MTSLSSEVRRAIKELLRAGFEVRVVGAAALAVTLTGGITRQTLDVDLIAKIPDWSHFPTLVSALDLLGWLQDRSVEHRFLHPQTGQILDLVAYVLEEPNVIRWPVSGNEMSTVGLEELFRSSASEIAPGVPVIPSLAALVLLKLAAFRDRHFPRDIADFLDALSGFDPGNRVYELVARHESLTVEECCARALGEEVGNLGLTQASRAALSEVLDTVVGDPNLLRSVGSRLTETDEEAERRVVARARLIAAFRAGLAL